MVAGVVAYKLCDQRFECETCSFDQAIRNRSERLFAGVSGAEDPAARWLLFHPRHTWARIEAEGKIRTGLDDFGRRLAGQIYCVELPKPGDTVRAGEPAWTIAHHDGKIGLASPVSGVVEEVNDRLLRHPALAYKDPYGDGWAIVVSPSSLPGDLKGLRYGADPAWLASETERLARELGSGSTLMDGGHLIENIHEAIPAGERARLLELFLSAVPNSMPAFPARPGGGESEGS
jgi:glycine cleavage system H lipoate-binding protein